MSEAVTRSPWADVILTSDARNVLDRAGAIASARGMPPYTGDASDVLTALMEVRGTLAQRAIRDLGIDPAALASSVPARNGVPGLPLRQVVLNSSREATVLGHYQVDSIHLLLAMLYSDTPATSAVLQAAGVTLYDLRRHLQTAAPPTETPARGPARPARRTPPPDAALRRRPLQSLNGVVTVSPVFFGLLAATAAAGAVLWFGLLPDALGVTTVVFVLGGWIISLCVHEFAHAAVAYVGGDRSVAAQGYLSMNPLRYHNVFMSTVLPIAFLLLGGIGLPGGAVYIDHSAIRSRVWDSAVSVAGPVGTLICGLLIAAVFSFPGHESWVNPTNFGFFAALAFLGFIEFSAVILNLIPIPGLDGFGILAPWLPISARLIVYRYATFAMIGLFLALWYVPPIRDAYFQVIFHVSGWANIDPNLVFIGLASMPHL